MTSGSVTSAITRSRPPQCGARGCPRLLWVSKTAPESVVRMGVQDMLSLMGVQDCSLLESQAHGCPRLLPRLLLQAHVVSKTAVPSPTRISDVWVSKTAAL